MHVNTISGVFGSHSNGRKKVSMRPQMITPIHATRDNPAHSLGQGGGDRDQAPPVPFGGRSLL